MIFLRYLECRLPRVATWPRSRMRVGGVQTSPSRRVRRRVGARRGLKLRLEVIGDKGRCTYSAPPSRARVKLQNMISVIKRDLFIYI